MGRDSSRKGDPKAPPALIVLRPRLDLVHHESRPSKQERHGHVVPECKADEVQDIEMVPPDALPYASERGAWMAALADQLASAGLDPHALGLKLAPSCRARVGEDGRSGSGQIDEALDVIQGPSFPLGREQEATGRESHAQGAKLAKAVHPPWAAIASSSSSFMLSSRCSTSVGS